MTILLPPLMKNTSKTYSPPKIRVLMLSTIALWGLATKSQLPPVGAPERKGNSSHSAWK